MKNLKRLLNRALNLLAGGSFLAMVLLICWQVFTRYVLQKPSSWSEEMVSYMFAWMSLLGSSLVVGERGQMNIPILTERLRGNAKKALEIFAEVVAFLFSVVILVYGGVRITALAMGQMTSSLGVPIGVFYIVLPLSGVLNMVYTILNVIDLVAETTERV